MSKKAVRTRARKTTRKRPSVPRSKPVSTRPLKKAMDQIRKQLQTAARGNPKAEKHVSRILTKYDDLVTSFGCGKVMTIQF